MEKDELLEEFIELLRSSKKIAPNLRIGQIIEIANSQTGLGQDVFNVTDQRLVNGFKIAINKLKI